MTSQEGFSVFQKTSECAKKETIRSQEDMSKSISSSLIHNGPNVGQMTINKSVHKQIMVDSQNGLLLSNKSNKFLTYRIAWTNLLSGRGQA